MNNQHSTFDLDSLKTFRGLGTEREVFVNADPEGRIVFLYNPSIGELESSIDEFILRKFNSWWDENIIKVMSTEENATLDKKSSHPRQLLPFANGFRAYEVSRKCKGKIVKDTVLSYLRSSCLRSYIDNLQGDYACVADFVIGLPLEEQAELLKKIRPVTIEGFHEILLANVIKNDILHFDFRGFLNSCETAEFFLDTLSGVICKSLDVEIANHFRLREKQTESTRVMEYLSLLNEKGWLLFNKRALLMQAKNPQNNSRLNVSSSLGQSTFGKEPQTKLIKAIIDEYDLAFDQEISRKQSNAFNKICLLIKSSTIEDIGDFSPELLAFNENELEPDIQVAKLVTTVKHITTAIIRLYKNDERYDNQKALVMASSADEYNKLNNDRSLMRTYGFKWVLNLKPEFKVWVDLFDEYLINKRAVKAEHLYSSLNRWIDYLLTLENPPLSPEEVVRSVHIRNVVDQSADTYWKFISSQEIVNNTKTRVFAKLHHFFGYYYDKLIEEFEQSKDKTSKPPEFTNPIRDDDRWHGHYLRKTNRYALPTQLLDLLVDTLLERDESGIPTFKWAKTLFSSDWTTQSDVDTRESVRVWWPGRVIALYVLLTIPIRTFQVRWLDEGVGDEFIYDFEQQKMVTNQHSSAEKNRKEGLFRLIGGAFNSEPFLGVYVNTNKTKIWDPSITHGYEIPWADNEFYGVMKIMRDWNRRFLPNPLIVTFADDPSEIVTEGAIPDLPGFYPLFRDVTTTNGRSKNIPITRDKINELWNKLLGEVEGRLSEQGQNISLVDWVIDKKYSLKKTVPKAKFDLHTLRVSGITGLLNKGIPIHIVSKFIAGHSTIIMTLYYEKTSHLSAREVLLQAQGKASTDLEKWVSQIEVSENPESLVVWNTSDFKNDDAVTALKNNEGIWTIKMDGICPGTLCEEGGPTDSKGVPTPIPSGACGLCRYFITGPGFLFGQTQKINTLLYEMNEKGEELKGLRSEEIDLKDSKNKQKQAETRGRRERIERELKDKMQEWHNRIRMWETSGAMLNKYDEEKKNIINTESTQGGNENLPLLTVNNEENIKFAMKNGTNFGLIREINRSYEILGNFDFHKGPILEFEEFLNTILIKNGFDAFLLTIPKDKRISAANRLASFLTDSFSEEDVERLYSGELELPYQVKNVTRNMLDGIKTSILLDTPDLERKAELVQIQD